MTFITQVLNILAAWSRALRLTWQSNPTLTFLALLSSMFIGLAVPVQVWISKVMIDAVAGALATGATSTSWTTFILPTLAFIAVWVVSQVMESVTGNLVTVLAQYAMLRGQMLIARKAASMDVASFEDPTFHNQLKLARDQVFRIYNVTFQLIQAGTQVITLLSLLILLGGINIILPLILLACTMPKIMLQTRHVEQRVGIFGKYVPAQRLADYMSTLLVSRDAVKEVKLFQLSDFLLNRMQEATREFLKELTRSGFSQERWNALVGVLPVISTASIWLYTATEALAQRISLGELALTFQVTENSRRAMDRLTFLSGHLAESTRYLINLFNFLDLPASSMPGSLKRPAHHAPHTQSARSYHLQQCLLSLSRHIA